MVLKLVTQYGKSVKGSGEDHAISNRATIEKVFVQHKVSLFRYIRSKVRSEEDALDLVQESYTRLLEQNNISGEKLTRSYLFTVALNLIRDRARRAVTHSVQTHEPLDDVELIDQASSLDDDVIWKKSQSQLKKVLKELSPRSRKIFILRRSKQLSCQEIAELLNISKRTVERELVITMEHCFERMKDYLK
jgi:RNA polymerase sigma factor (sigma-70 family)